MSTQLIARGIVTAALAWTINTSTPAWAQGFNGNGSWGNDSLIITVGDHKDRHDRKEHGADRREIKRFIRDEAQKYAQITVATWQWKEAIRELRREIRRYRRELDNARRHERHEIREVINDQYKLNHTY